MIVVLDSGPLGLVTNPSRKPTVLECKNWLNALIASDVCVMVPEIADYEVRRELLRGKKKRGLLQLDLLIRKTDYVGITTAAMRWAAEFWAEARSTGRQTTDDKRLDADVILAAQAVTLELPDVVIATTNVQHLSRFCTAALWSDISPN